MTDAELLSEIHKRLDYNPEKGEFYRKAGRVGVVAGALIGAMTTGGKLQATFLGKRYQVDALVWLIENGSLPEGRLIHENKNNLDSYIGNLLDRARPETFARLPHLVKARKLKEARAAARRPALTKDELNLRRRQSRKKRIEACRSKERAYRETNREMYRESFRKYYRENINDPVYRSTRVCRQILSSVIAACKLNKLKPTENMIGYSFLEFKQHIEKQFEVWMCWGNHGAWHVDHKKPIAAFIAEGITDPKIINALSNLRPLIAVENMRKGSRYEPR